MKNEHTPGPWEVVPGEWPHAPNIVVIASGMTARAPLAKLSCLLGDEEAMPDAHLIAAAPDMLLEIEKQIDWLKFVKSQIETTDSVMMGLEQSIKYLSAVAAKARGKS